ncbi:MAG TPA: efflux RND transporter permease subunit, partial [Paracoccus sp.]|nr:efflux RND transporter permease subunit [Paracoccus sp. (in: a-proteobacteria)]
MAIIPRSAGLVDLCIRRPTLAVVISLLIVIAGLVALTAVDVREMPAVDQPVLSVSTTWSGASPEAVETQVTRVLEDALSRLEGLKAMSSRSRYGNSRITLELRTNADIELSVNSAREIVSQTIRQLPENIDEPRILRNDSDADPIVRLAVSGDLSIPELSVIAEDVIAERLALIDGVAEVIVTGTQRQQFRIEADMVSLMARGLSMDDVAGALRSFDVQTPLGSLDLGGDTISLRSAAPEISAETIGNMRIDRATRVSDVAFVSLASEERRSSAYVDGRLSVGVDVVRDSLGNTLSVSQDVRAAVEELSAVLPSGVSVVITSDDGVFIEQSIGEVVSSIIMATMIVVLTIYAFLGSVRATIIPAIAIPVALVGSIATVWLAGFSINTITLLALVLATGLVVDDAIVVVENIVRKRRQGMGPRAAALSGAGEVFFAVLSTTITLAAVFIPVSFLPGQAGSIFSEFGFVLAFCVALSSVVALILAPVVAVMVDPGRFETREEAAWAAGDSRMGKIFDWTVDRVIRSPFMVLAVSVSLAIIAFGIARDIPSEVTPPEDRGFFVIVARASAGDGVEAMDAAIADMEGIISRYRDAGLINAVQSFSGRGGGSSAFVIVRLTDWSARNASQHDVMAHLGQELAGIEGVTAFMRASNSLGIRGGSGGLSFAIAARDRSVIDASADLLLNAMAQDPHFMSPQLSGVTLQPALEVDLDHDIAQDLGLDETALNTTLNAMLEGQTVASVF